MAYELITTPAQLDDLCARLAEAPTIAFDTEFVSEHTYRPELCLVQVAFGSTLVLIDPLAAPDLTAFWRVLAAPGHETIVHAGRQELLFCLESVDAPPHRLFDVQLAAGMIGLEYPAGYGSLLGKLLGQRPSKGETRTDWRRRPLSSQQLEYALDDVRYLDPLRRTLGAKLARLGREAWFHDEMTAWQNEVNASRTAERWRRVTGSSGLSARSLVIVRDVWLWREGEAQRRNLPVRQVLRDDLIVELAKRRSADPKQIGAVRGMERGDLRRIIPELAKVVAHSLEVDERLHPENTRVDVSPQVNMLGQFLSSALSSLCRDAEVATSLVGTASDVRDLVMYHLEQKESPGKKSDAQDEPPTLMRGWRAQVVGKLFEDLLDGRVSIRVADPHAEQPLAFERPGDTR
ncbi:MAG TPA: HRDC domain-containing protein [Pirellulales bacterium]|jgi:ribonuclease D|nr:HRDC domain-containing protein [Pirellulales bacterium]